MVRNLRGWSADSGSTAFVFLSLLVMVVPFFPDLVGIWGVFAEGGDS
jgi:hypothetical protein